MLSGTWYAIYMGQWWWYRQAGDQNAGREHKESHITLCWWLCGKRSWFPVISRDILYILCCSGYPLVILFLFWLSCGYPSVFSSLLEFLWNRIIWQAFFPKHIRQRQDVEVRNLWRKGLFDKSDVGVFKMQTWCLVSTFHSVGPFCSSKQWKKRKIDLYLLPVTR